MNETDVNPVPNDGQLHDVLKQYFGFDRFRDGQLDVIRAVFAGKDVTAVMATGGGKSLCYELPASKPHMFTLVITPLKALMENQVAHLKNIKDSNGKNPVKAAYINGEVGPEQCNAIYADARAGRLNILYVTPEKIVKPDFQAFVSRMAVKVVAIDEAHCVREWGWNFRESYLNLGGFIASLHPRPTVLALSATLSNEQAKDVREMLGMKGDLTYRTPADRPNIRLHSVNITRQRDRLAFMLDWIRAHPNDKGIIYREIKKNKDRNGRVVRNDNCEMITEFLQSNGVDAACYHADINKADKANTVQEFIDGTVQVVVATSAFGMGVDIPGVRWVISDGPYENLEGFWQEAGRAGRDGREADSIVIWWDGDFKRYRDRLKTDLKNAEKKGDEGKERLASAAQGRLSQMSNYCEGVRSVFDNNERKVIGRRCMRSQVLELLSDAPVENCGSCSVCNPDIDHGIIAEYDEHAAASIQVAPPQRRETKGETIPGIPAQTVGKPERKPRKDGRFEIRSLANTQDVRDAMRIACAYVDAHMKANRYSVGAKKYAAGLMGKTYQELENDGLVGILYHGGLKGRRIDGKEMDEQSARDIINAAVSIGMLNSGKGLRPTLSKGPDFDRYMTEGIPTDNEIPCFEFTVKTNKKQTPKKPTEEEQDPKKPTEEGQNLREPTEEEYANACGLIKTHMATDPNGWSAGVNKLANWLIGKNPGGITKEQLDTYPQYGSFCGDYEQATHIYDRLREQGAIEKGPYNTLIPGPRFKEFLHPQHRQEGDG